MSMKKVPHFTSKIPVLQPLWSFSKSDPKQHPVRKITKRCAVDCSLSGAFYRS